MNRYPCIRSLTLASLMAVGACYGNDTPTGIEETTEEAVENPSFAADVGSIFTSKGCTNGSCHGSGAGDLTLTVDAATNYANLVGVTASGEPTFQLVEAGDAQNSYLVIKLEGRQSSGGRMPLGRSALSMAEIQTIRNWIDAGALNN